MLLNYVEYLSFRSILLGVRAIILPDSDVQVVWNKEWVMEAVPGMSTV